MKKLVIVALSAVLALMAIEPAHAQDQKVIAIIDTAIDSSKFGLSIIHEVCFTQNKSCPNGTDFMEGRGSARALVWASSVNHKVYHGDSMVKSALFIDPSVKIVFIRYSNITPAGNNINAAESLINAIEWVSKNAVTYSIDSLSISMSGVGTDEKTKATFLHPACTDAKTINSVSELIRNNVPTFAAAGNERQSHIVGFPACVPGVIGVGVVSNVNQNLLQPAVNRGPGLDLVSMANVSVTKVNNDPRSLFVVPDTSAATINAATAYVKKNTFKTSQEYFNSLPKILVRVNADANFNATVMYSSN
jgi:hypothetical protein